MFVKVNKNFVILICSFALLLNLIVEFSHHHHLSGKAVNADNGMVSGQLHGYVCIACMLAMSQYSPVYAFRVIKPSAAHTCDFTEKILPFQSETFDFFNLRAPPTSL